MQGIQKTNWPMNWPVPAWHLSKPNPTKKNAPHG
jgi:hypothetical protein